jgi:hypothetical protein
MAAISLTPDREDLGLAWTYESEPGFVPDRFIMDCVEVPKHPAVVGPARVIWDALDQHSGKAKCIWLFVGGKPVLNDRENRKQIEEAIGELHAGHSVTLEIPDKVAGS